MFLRRLGAVLILTTLASRCGVWAAEGVPARPEREFLFSLGACVHVQHHQDAGKLAESIRYTGIRTVRDGADANYDMTGLLRLHSDADVTVCFGPGSGAQESSISKTMTACKTLASAGALLAIEGPNEPNNFGGVTYEGKNSAKLVSWLPVARYQQAFFKAAKSDPVLQAYPVYSVSEAGAEDDNAGLQFLVIPKDAATLMPAGTQFADGLNCHNYVCGHIKGLIDNQATLAAAVKSHAAIDDLFGNHGRTWRHHFAGYSQAELDKIPKVTTETGWRTDDTPAGDERQGKVLINTYLAQYKAGWAHTFVYEFADDSDGAFGFVKSDLTTPRASAHDMHHLTAILDDHESREPLAALDYHIADQPKTVHDLLLQRSDGNFDLLIWGEQVKGSNEVKIELPRAWKSIEIYDPTQGSEAIRVVNGASLIELTISDHLLIARLKNQPGKG